MRIRTKEDGFEYQVSQMVKKFARDFDGTIEEDFNGDINDAIWENKEEFGEIVYNIISEYFGEEMITAMYENIKDKKEIERKMREENE